MVGFYDSGLGGLGILEEVLKLKPDFSYWYLADTEVLPLGDKQVGFIQHRVKLACQYFFANGCDLVVLACNTASVNAIRHIQQVWLPAYFPDKQVLGVSRPLVEYLEMNFADLKNEPGLVLSTSATHQTGFYQYEIRSVGFQNLQFLACPGLAEAVEEGDSQKQFDILQNLVGNNQLRPTQAKLVVLGCTHYKFAQSSIQGVFSRAKIVEPSQFIATRLLDYLVRHPEFDSPNLGQQLVSTAEFKNGISQFNYTGLVSLAVPQLNTQGGN